MMNNAKYIEVIAGARYWEDAYINGQPDIEGKVPFRKGDAWCPVIDVDAGIIVDWPNDIEAKIHYKVCDDGEYYILDNEKKRIGKWKGYYVPDNILCIGSKGYGDYLIMTVDNTGKILNWKKPYFDEEEWELIPL